MEDLIDRAALLKSMGLTDAVKYGNKDAEQQYRSYSTWMSYEIADSIWDAPAVNRWISVEDALPETDTPVICYMRSGQILVMELSDDDGWYCGITRYNPRAVTHWMPLPEIPEQPMEVENENR